MEARRYSSERVEVEWTARDAAWRPVKSHCKNISTPKPVIYVLNHVLFCPDLIIGVHRY